LENTGSQTYKKYSTPEQYNVAESSNLVTSPQLDTDEDSDDIPQTDPKEDNVLDSMGGILVSSSGL